MNFPKEIDQAAKICAGNWMKFEDFGWANRDLDHEEDWFVYHLANRDSGFQAQSNEYVFESVLSPYDFDVRKDRFSHWGVGWVNVLVIRVYDACSHEVTEAFKKWHELAMCLEEYPLLDDSDYSQREYDAALLAIENIAPTVTDERWIDLPADKPGWSAAIFGWLWENDQEQLENVDDQGAYPSKESVLDALIGLGIKYEG